MTTLTEEMQAVIEKSLPAATAGAMRDFISEAEATKAALEAAEKDFIELEKLSEVLRDDNKKLQSMIESQESLDATLQEVLKLKEEVAVRERDIELIILKSSLAAANERNVVVERLVDKVFGHPSVTVRTSKDVVFPVDGSQGSCGYAHRENSVMESQTTTESKV